MRQFSVSVRGRFPDEAVPQMKRQLEGVRATKVDNYDVYPEKTKLPSVVTFHIHTDATPEEMEAVLAVFNLVESIHTEEINAVQTV